MARPSFKCATLNPFNSLEFLIDLNFSIGQEIVFLFIRLLLSLF